MCHLSSLHIVLGKRGGKEFARTSFLPAPALHYHREESAVIILIYILTRSHFSHAVTENIGDCFSHSVGHTAHFV